MVVLITAAGGFFDKLQLSAARGNGGISKQIDVDAVSGFDHGKLFPLFVLKICGDFHGKDAFHANHAFFGNAHIGLTKKRNRSSTHRGDKTPTLAMPANLVTPGFYGRPQPLTGKLQELVLEALG